MKKILVVLSLCLTQFSAHAAEYPFLKSQYPDLSKCGYTWTGMSKIESMYKTVIEKTIKNTGSKWYALSLPWSYPLWEEFGHFAEYSEYLIWTSLPASRDLFYAVQNELILQRANPAFFSDEDKFGLAIAAVHYQLGYTASPSRIADFMMKYAGRKFVIKRADRSDTTIDGLDAIIGLSNFSLADLGERWSFALAAARDTDRIFSELDRDFYLLSPESKRAAAAAQELVGTLTYIPSDNVRLMAVIYYELEQMSKLTSLTEVVRSAYQLYGVFAHLRLVGQLSSEVLKDVLSSTELKLVRIMRKYEPNLEEIRPYFNDYSLSDGPLMRDTYAMTGKRIAYLGKFLRAHGSTLGVDGFGSSY